MENFHKAAALGLVAKLSVGFFLCQFSACLSVAEDSTPALKDSLFNSDFTENPGVVGESFPAGEELAGTIVAEEVEHRRQYGTQREGPPERQEGYDVQQRRQRSSASVAHRVTSSRDFLAKAGGTASKFLAGALLALAFVIIAQLGAVLLECTALDGAANRGGGWLHPEVTIPLRCKAAPGLLCFLGFRRIGGR